LTTVAVATRRPSEVQRSTMSRMSFTAGSSYGTASAPLDRTETDADLVRRCSTR
jgi:hypothetical protein